MNKKSMRKSMLKSFTVRMIVSICLVFGFLLAVPGTVDAKYLSYNGIKELLSRISLKSIPIWHLQVEITVADKKKSGTDDGVYFKLKNGDRYYLNIARNDFEKGKKYTFSLLYPGVSKIGDIQYLVIGKKGKDGLCLKRIELYINKATNSPIFSKTYSNGKWIDGNDGYNSSITFQLNDSAWRLKLSDLKSMNMLILPTVISQSNLEDLIESKIGDAMVKYDLRNKYYIKWYKKGKEPVTVNRVDQNTIKVDVDWGLKWKKLTHTIDIDFKIDFKIDNKNIEIKARDFSIKFDFNLLLKLGLPFTTTLLKTTINEIIKDKLSGKEMVLYKAYNLMYIPEIKVKGDGDIEINWQIPVLKSH